MPIYEFRCAQGHTWDLLYPITNIPECVRCETCLKIAKRVYSVPAIRFTGPGFYNTDYRQGKKREDQKDQSTPQETKEKADAGKSSATSKSA